MACGGGGEGVGRFVGGIGGWGGRLVGAIVGWGDGCLEEDSLVKIWWCDYLAGEGVISWGKTSWRDGWLGDGLGGGGWLEEDGVEGWLVWCTSMCIIWEWMVEGRTDEGTVG
jgi:hypothetical protein